MNESDKHITCEWVQDLMDAFLDEELNSSDASKFETHLSSCSTCSEEFELAKRMMVEIRNLPELRCPDRVINAAMAHIETEHQQAPWHQKLAWSLGGLTRWWRFAAVAAVFLIVVIPILLHKQPQQPPEMVKSEELVRAERQVELTFAYIGHISNRSASSVCDKVVDSGIAPPLKRALNRVMESEALPFKYIKSLGGNYNESKSMYANNITGGVPCPVCLG
jgi:hypothetical protein